MSKHLNACEIKALYFEKLKPSNELTTNKTPTPHIGGNDSKINLSPSARFILSETKKYLSELFREDTESKYVKDSEFLEDLVKQVEEAQNELLSTRERNSVIDILKQSRLNYDVLTPLIEDDEVNDVIVSSYNDISVQISGRRNISTDLSFVDKASYTSFIEQLLKRVGKSVSTASPVVDASIEQDVRACVTHESFSPPGSGPMLTLRISRHKDVNLEELYRYELAPKEVLEYLKSLISLNHITGLIAGEVGTGKTTLVKALSMEIPEDEAILIIEDTFEIALNRKFTRTLLTREANTEGAGKITPAKAIRTGMRMAMNRVILGEMRDGLAGEAFIDVCSSGHSGLSTIHARSARDALSRLELFLSRERGHSNTESIRREIANAISVVVYLAVDESGKRRIKEVVEVGSASDGPPQIQPMYKLIEDPLGGYWKREGGISLFDKELKKIGLTLSIPNSKLRLENNQSKNSFY